jgi:hypothetical protein
VTVTFPVKSLSTDPITPAVPGVVAVNPVTTNPPAPVILPGTLSDLAVVEFVMSASSKPVSAPPPRDNVDPAA